MLAIIAAGSIAAALAAATPLAAGAAPKPSSAAPAPRAAAGGGVTEHKVYGFVESLTGTTLIVRNRRGAPVMVDARLAHASLRVFPGRAVIVFGTADPSGTIHATRVWRTFPDAAHWPADQ